MNMLFAVLPWALLASDSFCLKHLDRLLVTYREYGLPLPPGDAKLVRYTCKPYIIRREGKQVEESADPALGFSLDGRTVLNPWNQPETVETVTPVQSTLAAIGGIHPGGLRFAMAYHDRGWKSLALVAFRKWTLANESWDTEDDLARDAWHHWERRIHFDPKTPLATITKYLKRTLSQSGRDNEFNRAIVHSLELSLMPSRAQPGGDEALIDDLIQLCRESSDFSLWDSGLLHDPRYRAIVQRGLAIVPSLIAHLDDERMTRSIRRLEGLENLKKLRVRDVALEILAGLAGGPFVVRDATPEATAEAVVKWFGDASKLGEEGYVVSRLFGRDKADPEFNPTLFHVVTQKYPDRLPDLYRELIDNYHDLRRESWRFAQAVDQSLLAANVKHKILEYAARHDVMRHRVAGIHFLRRIDPKQAQGLLLAAIDRLPSSPSEEERTIAWLIAQNGDSLEWQALAKAARGMETVSRLEVLSVLARNASPAGWEQRLAFLESHLTDDAAPRSDEPREFRCRSVAGWEFVIIEMRNYAAMKLAELLQLDADPRPDWKPEQWARLREQVRVAVAKELGR